jgi:hypothetical protein
MHAYILIPVELSPEHTHNIRVTTEFSDIGTK